MLVSIGRRPYSDGLGLEEAGVERDNRGFIKVDHVFQTNVAGIYAIGDVTERLNLTPVALAEGQLVARALFAEDQGNMDYQNIATAVFCHPNIGTVGLSEEQGINNGLQIDVYSATVKQLKHTLSGNDELSMIKLVVDRNSDRVVGLHIVGPDAGELVQGFAVAMNCGATKADFDRTIGVHPTMAEEVVTMRTRRDS